MTAYTVDINTVDGHQQRRIDADGYILNLDGSLTLFLSVGDGRIDIALFAADKWICVRDMTPGNRDSLKDLAKMQAVT